jgi:hypothetical protein
MDLCIVTACCLWRLALRAYIQACFHECRGAERFGSANVAAIASVVEGKAPSDVERYAKVFFQRVAEVEGVSHIIRYIHT